MHSAAAAVAGKQLRIALTVLQRSKYEGGIALPNVRAYYEAAQVSIMHGHTLTCRSQHIEWIGGAWGTGTTCTRYMVAN
mgnify:CR=1 FL=1